MTIRITDKCCPADWVDEAVPTPGANPSEFLLPRDGQVYLVDLDDRQKFIDGTLCWDNWNYKPEVLAVGAEVAFMFNDSDFPPIRFTVLNDGEIRLLDAVPVNANLFGDRWEIIHDDPLTAAREVFEYEADTREISAWYWSDPVVYIVCMDASGHPYFERKGGPQ